MKDACIVLNDNNIFKEVINSSTDDAHNIDATLMRQKSSKTYDRYNSMNIDMTQMFTNSNICPE